MIGDKNGVHVKFLRRRAEEPDHAARAAAFWQRWEELLPVLSSALGEREPRKVEPLLCDTVAALHPDLHFTIERGHESVYALVVSAQGDPALRPYTDAWLAAAPEPSALWEYHDAVPAVPDPTQVTVNLGAHRLALGQVRVSARVDEAAGVVDVEVYHPRLAELDDAAKAAMTFLPLDATLGERLAADRLGRVETAETEPDDSIGLLEFRALVRELDRLAGG
ncbi:hypothetical protein NLX83_02480 [Allokutzneria sp. A3M-2-11 16]|uniref:hypothetical protein n=1 Tax=Allokutzneria sp. A3M-2-11 16 TaxID=2962043 RepID=UPI0020B6D523|nr:hypothetical protein [Allokutzneria sp. A3M-2-11 16]MCP3798114.1 hypothetical protein [Allokutzneria sp. A3M-2-11 16]